MKAIVAMFLILTSGSSSYARTYFTCRTEENILFVIKDEVSRTRVGTRILRPNKVEIRCENTIVREDFSSATCDVYPWNTTAYDYQIVHDKISKTYSVSLTSYDLRLGPKSYTLANPYEVLDQTSCVEVTGKFPAPTF